jgi:hypothetical protein
MVRWSIAFLIIGFFAATLRVLAPPSPGPNLVETINLIGLITLGCVDEFSTGYVFGIPLLDQA